jgi:uracil-DNA glycosylase family protein
VTESLTSLRKRVQECRACELHQGAMQAVFGEGSARAKVMFVGEQPGARGDREGRPFVGPASHVFDRTLEEAGIDRKQTYVTNAVKHFRYEERGKRRIHQRPSAVHIRACRPWLDAELAAVRPRVLVCLGAVAAQALLGSKIRVTKDRGKPLESELAPIVLVTIHPSAILRERDEPSRGQAFRAFVAELEIVGAELSRD